MKKLYPIGQALLAAALFGASAPIAKLLLGQIAPVTLAALLYLGSGFAIMLIKFGQRLARLPVNVEAQIKRPDWGWLAGAVIAGGVAAPIVLLFSLRSTPASTASLLLNFEGVATTVIAVVIFKEAIGRFALIAIACTTIASIILSWTTDGQWGISLGAIGILGACTLWGIDNNFTNRISGRDPLAIVMVKGLGAGTFSLILSFILGNALPSIGSVISALLVGSFSYGISIMLFIYALRGLGAARTSTLFSTAPLVGVVLSIVLFKDTPTIAFGVGLVLMVLAAGLLIVERQRSPQSTTG